MVILIKGGQVISPKNDIDFTADILIEDGAVKKISKEPIVAGNGTKIIEAKGKYVIPGLIDPHVHLRDPGLTHKEDILTGAMAAAAGGFTSVVCMPNTKPPIDSAETIKYIIDKAKNSAVKVYPSCCITKGMAGKELCDYEELKAAGAIAITDDGHPVKNAAMLQEAMKTAEELGLTVMSHCEDMDIIGNGIINKGEVSDTLGVEGMDRTSEDSITAREIAIAAATNTSIHICHVSTKGSVSLIRDAKARGVKVSGETAPHYLHFTHEELLKKDANFRMNPPLREGADKKALIEGLIDGTIEMIATDHAPHAKEEKADFLKAPNGIIGLETSFAASYTALVDSSLISLSRLVELMSVNPAKLVGIEGGSIEEGKTADIAIFDTEELIVTKEMLKSKSENTPFIGKKLKGRILYTILNGNISYERKAD